jgi:putative chitinase
MTKLADAVRSIAPHCNAAYLDGFDACAAAFDKYEINANPLRQSHFLGQFLGETDGGVILTESGNYTHAARIMAIFGVGRHSAAITQSEAEKIVALPMPQREKVLFERVYGAGNPHKMNELGNRPGDGWPFRGTGPIQSTGRGAAKAWADKLGMAMQDDQLWMLDPKIIFMPSLFEWDAGKLNAFADRNDGRHIRRIINGGYNGLQDCEDWQAKAYAALRDPAVHAEQPWQQAQPDPSMSAIQNSLNLLGYVPKLTMDGRFGPATKTAVRWYQTLANLPVDGIPGPVTVTSMNLRFATKRAA